MLTYDLKVGYGCNNKCKHCVIDDSKDKLLEKKESIDLTTEECISQIDYALSKGAKNIVLTGGEVTIRKDFIALLYKCHENNLNITVQTNGRMLANKKIIEAIKPIDKIRFVVALHGDNANTHDNITQAHSSFNQTCNGIQKMCEINKLVVLKIVISKINFKELSGIVKLASKLGAKYLCFAFPHGHGSARKNFDEVIPTYETLKPIFEDLIQTSKIFNVNIEFEAVPFCIIPKHMQYVGELKYFDGNTLCTQVKEETFDWNKIRRSIKRKGEQCKNCDMNDFCEGVWSEYAEAFGANELKPIKFPSTIKEKALESIKNKLIQENKNSNFIGI